jgi:hypothetical protein
MTWSEIRRQYPSQWLLVEAVDVHSEGDQRILDDIAVLQNFTDVESAMNRYKVVHRQSPFRELYVLHTDRAELEISETRIVSVWVVS